MMKRMWTAKKRKTVCSANFLCLLIFSVFFSGCSSHDKQFSYFNMLDSEKRTLHNKKTAKKFWSAVRPVSTLSASHYKLGLYYQQNEKYGQAIKEFIKAVRNDNSFCKAYNGIGMSFDALHRCEQAHDSYEQALLCDPNKAYLYNNYACSSLICGNYEKGLALLIKAIELSGENSRIQNNLRLAQMINDHRNPPVMLMPQAVSVTVPPTPKTGMQPVESEVDPSLISQLDELPETPAPMGETQKTGIIDWEVVKHIENSQANTDNFVAEKSNKTIIATETEYSMPKLNGAVEVSNGNGVTGMAGRVADYFRSYGIDVGRLTNAKHFRFRESVIFYKNDYLPMAKQLARVIPGVQELKEVNSLGRPAIGVRILLGKDLVNVQLPKDYGLTINNLRIEKELLAVSTSMSPTVK